MHVRETSMLKGRIDELMKKTVIIVKNWRDA